MADSKREALLKRAKLLQQAQEVHAASQAPEEDTGINAEDAMGKLKTGMRAMDYDRATTGGPLLAKALEKITGKPITKPPYKDVLKLKADFPNSAEMFKQVGIPAGYSGSELSKKLADATDLGISSHPAEGMIQPGDPLDITIRGVGGALTDMATAPSTYLSAGTSAAVKYFKQAQKEIPLALNVANKVFNPIEAFMNWRGDKAYKRAFAELDAKAMNRGKSLMPSTVLQGERFSGNMGDARDTLEAVSRREADLQKALLKEQAAKGVTVDMEHVFQPAMEEAKKLDKMLSPEAHQLAKDIRARVSYMQRQTAEPAFWTQYHVDKATANGMSPEAARLLALEHAQPGGPYSYRPESWSKVADPASELDPLLGGPGTPRLPERGTTQIPSNLPGPREQVLGSGTSRRSTPPPRPGASGTFEHNPGAWEASGEGLPPPAADPEVLGTGTSRRAPPPGPRTYNGHVTPFSYGTYPVDKANEEKSFIDNLIKDSGFDQGPQAALGTREKESVANSFREAIPKEVAKVDLPAAKRLVRHNQMLSATDSSIQELVTNLARRRVENQSPLWPTGAELGIGAAMATAGGLGGGYPGAATGASLLLAKKLRDALRTTAGLTARGKWATKLGNTYGLIDSGVRHGWESPASVYEAMQDDENK